MSFSKIFQILFIDGSTFLIFIPERLNKFMVVFLSIFLNIWRAKKSFPPNLTRSSKDAKFKLGHPLIIVFDCENSVYPSGAIQESFQFDSPEAIISKDLFVLNI